MSSNRSSLPVLRMRKRRKPESRIPQTMTKRVAIIFRAGWILSVVPIERVRIARMTKFVPPAKSVLMYVRNREEGKYNLSI